MSPATDSYALATAPEYFLNRLNLEAGEAEFLKLDADSLRRSAFLDHRIKSGTNTVIRSPLAPLREAVQVLEQDAAAHPINYIFHSAFCCSTLISRCMDIAGVCCTIREPFALTQLANYKRQGAGYHFADAEWSGLLDMALFLLAKSHGPREAVLIKPTNAANNLAAGLLAHPRTGGVLLLYSSLERFLASILRKGEAGRNFVRLLFNVLRGDSPRTANLDPAALTALTDLQAAALVWYLHMDAYLQLLVRFPGANIRTLDCEVFLAQPEETIAKLCRLFAVSASASQLRQIVDGPLLHRSSKNDAQDYDAAARDNEYRRVLQQYGEDIAAMRRWSDGIRPEGPVSLPLPAAL